MAIPPCYLPGFGVLPGVSVLSSPLLSSSRGATGLATALFAVWTLALKVDEVVWILVDALCILCYDPQFVERSRAQKRQTINLMTLRASGVLFVDKSLWGVGYHGYSGTTQDKASQLLT
jgi:hypothetical protein